MREFRGLLLILFSIIAARLISETSSCSPGADQFCEIGLLIIVPFILSGYFVDSLFEELISSDSKKNKIMHLVFGLPYVAVMTFFVIRFVSTITIVTVEYIVSVNLLLAFLIFLVVYWLNTHVLIRKLNKIFMITFLVSLLIFQFI